MGNKSIRRATHPGFLTLLLAVCQATMVVCPAQDVPGPPPGQRKLGSEYGFIIFQQRCTSCHGNPAVEKAPGPAVLREMRPERIYAALTSGAMQVHAQGLSEEQIARVAESLSGRLMGTEVKGDAASMPNRCSSNPPMTDPAAGPSWNGWGGLHNTRHRTQAEAGLSVNEIPKLKLKWAFGFDQGISSFGQPAVVSGRVFVGTDTGYVYSLDAASGCVYWSFKPKSNVRNAINIGPITGHGQTRYAAYFGDMKANVYAVDAQNGKLLWTRRVEDHYTARVTSAPALYAGRLYVPISSWEEAAAKTLEYPCCTFRGSVVAMDANSGEVIWKTYTIPQQPQPVKKNSKGIQLWAPAGATVWNTPTVDAKRHAIYFGTGDAYTYPAAPTSDAIMALDMDTGKNLWTYQVTANDAYLVACQFDKTENCPEVVGVDWDIPAPVILQTMSNGQDALIVCTKPGDVLSLNPDKQGALNWRVNVAKNKSGYAGMRWGGASDGDNVYFGLTGGGVVAMKLATGETQWYSLLPGKGEKRSHDAAVTVLGDTAFVADMNGVVSALRTADGKEIWKFNTAREYKTVNGIPGRGGSISGVGPVISNGMLFVNSGYMIISGKPGNVLLAFSVK